MEFVQTTLDNIAREHGQAKIVILYLRVTLVGKRRAMSGKGGVVPRMQVKLQDL